MSKKASMQRGIAAIVAASTLAVGLLGCATTVPMKPTPNANDPACAALIVRLPDTVAGLERRTTNAQSTGAWGDPVGVELRCGSTPTGPTTKPCVAVKGVDWIIDDSQAPVYRFEAYGREPGLEVFVNNEIASGTLVATDLTNIAEMLPQTRACIGYDTNRAIE